MSVIVFCLILAALATARITRLLVVDEISAGLRRRVVKRWGTDSKITYLAHCRWCVSLWVAAPTAFVALAWPNRWVLAVLAIPAASYVTGLLSRLEE